MTHIGQTVDGPTRRDFWWCPRCGTIRLDGFGAFDEVPKLVDRCREFEAAYISAVRYDAESSDWKRSIAECIHKPEERTA